MTPRSRPFALVVLVLAVAVAVPAAAHDLWLVPASFAPAAGEVIGVELWLGEAGEAVPVARHDAMFERFVVVGPAGDDPAAEPTTLPVPGLPRRRPAGVLRPPAAGTWTVVYLGNREDLTLTAEQFARHLEERGLAEVERRWRDRGAPAPVHERFGRSLKSLVAVGGGSPVDRMLGLPLELVLERDDDGVCRIVAAAAGAPASGLRVDLRPLAEDAPPASAVADAEGRVALPCPAPGPWLATTVALAEDGERPGGWASTWTSLTFARPAAAESR